MLDPQKPQIEVIINMRRYVCITLCTYVKWWHEMEEWDPSTNDFVLRCNSCWRTNKNKGIKIVRTSREKYYCEQCLSMYDNLCHC